MNTCSFTLLMLVSLASLTGSVGDASFDEQIEMARSFSEAGRQATCVANHEPSTEISREFWQACRDFRAEDNRLNDDLKTIILSYSERSQNTAPEAAESPSEDALSMQIEGNCLKQKYL